MLVMNRVQCLCAVTAAQCDILDAKVLIRSSRVVASSQDETTKSFTTMPVADDCRYSWRGQQAIFADPDLPHTVCCCHAADDWDCCLREISTISRDHQSTACVLCEGVSRCRGFEHKMWTSFLHCKYTF